MKKLFVFVIVVLSLFINNVSFAQEEEFSISKSESREYYWYLSLVIDMHLEIGRWEVDKDSVFFAIGLLNDMKHYADMNIIEYLWYSFDIKKTFDNLLYDISDLLNQATASMDYIKKTLLSLQIKKTECDSFKDISDKNFYLAFKDFDTKNMQVNLDESLNHDRCSSESRIYYNIQDKILKELDFYYEILNQKYTYFYSNRFSIIENYQKILYELKK